MPRNPESSQPIQGIDATPTASVPASEYIWKRYWFPLYSESLEKTREFICRVENFVYLCARRIDTIVSQCTYALRLYKALPFVHICLRSCVGSPKLDKATPFLLPIHNYNF